MTLGLRDPRPRRIGAVAAHPVQSGSCVAEPPLCRPPVQARRAGQSRSRRLALAAVGVLVVLAFGLRVYDLGAAGLSEDEVRKLDAARAYLAGDFSQNLEHPMLMKGAIAATLAAADVWNARFASMSPISDEAAVRFPNVVVGALTTVVIFLFADLSFGSSAALAAAAFWAISAESVAINRVAKEDTFLVFFCWLAFYAYARAKADTGSEPRPRAAWYGLAGASFGLMLASKYFPHYVGVNFLFYFLNWWVNGPTSSELPLRRLDYFAFFGLMAGCFLLADPVIVSPHTLAYIRSYVDEETVTHHGYVMMDRLYRNSPWTFEGGLPVYFYALLLALKTQISVLAFAMTGAVVILRNWRRRPYLYLAVCFVLWFVPFSLVAGKWYRYTLSVMPVVVIAAGIGFVALWRLARAALARLDGWRRPLATAVAVGLAVAAFALPLGSVASAAPHYALYLNALGSGRAGYFFPHDEFYDDGLREAIAHVCADAPRGATVFGDAPPVYAYYFGRFGRDDLVFCPSYDRAARERASGPSYVVVQSGRRYFENREFLDAASAVGRPVATVTVDGATAARIFALRDPRDAGDAR